MGSSTNRGRFYGSRVIARVTLYDPKGTFRTGLGPTVATRLQDDDIRELMLDHGIKDAGVAAGQFKDAKKGWENESVEGLGIHPLDGFKKVGFIKVDTVSKASRDYESTFVNVIKHELGHMLNIKSHSEYGVMRGSIMLQGGSLDFNDGNIATITQTLVRLSTVSEAELTRRYEAQNP
jgi:hypothetical protein